MCARERRFQVEAVKYLLMVQEMERAIAFYRDALGLAVRSESPRWTELAFGDAVVALHGGGTGARSRTGLSVQVSDLAAACHAVAAAGGEVVREPEARPGEPIRLAAVVDTEGNELMLTERVDG